VDYSPAPLLDALDHLCHLVEGDPEFEYEFYAASTPDEMVTLAVDGGILIDAEDLSRVKPLGRLASIKLAG
jgi:hypothetical protein